MIPVPRVLLRSGRCASRVPRERESHLLNPPPGSTDPERFATVSIGIGDRVLFHPAPREPRHEWCEVSLRHRGRPVASDVPWPVRWAIRPPPPSHVISSPHGSSKTQARGRRAMPTLPQARGELCSGDHGVNESRTPSGTAPGARAEPVKPCPAFTLSGGPAPSRVGEFARKLRMHCQAFPAPPRQFCL